MNLPKTNPYTVRGGPSLGGTVEMAHWTAQVVLLALQDFKSAVFTVTFKCVMNALQSHGTLQGVHECYPSSSGSRGASEARAPPAPKLDHTFCAAWHLTSYNSL